MPTIRGAGDLRVGEKGRKERNRLPLARFGSSFSRRHVANVRVVADVDARSATRRESPRTATMSTPSFSSTDDTPAARGSFVSTAVWPVLRSPFTRWISAAVLLALVVHLGLRWQDARAPASIAYSTFLDYVGAGHIERVKIINDTRIRGTYTAEAVRAGAVQVPAPSQGLFRPGANGARRAFVTTKPAGHALVPTLRRHNQAAAEEGTTIAYTAVQKRDWTPLLLWGLPLGLLLGLGAFLLRRKTNGRQQTAGDTTATLFEEARGERATFDDVAGLEAAKAEVAEVVEFLRRPDAFTRLGGTLPTGVLLMGPPGTGKTLLAKAVAGEAGVPFFSISGSDFTEMFVGVGARRVRDLFETAKEKAPCIIFIDEIDAVGRTRGGGQGGSGVGERDNTLNQLLVEMDGFNSEKGVIIMGATNRPDVLDAALLRPGRFDRQIAIHKPDRLDRAAIFRVHVQDLRLHESVSPERLARRTPGFAGAEIANVCNEAALLAARAGKPTVQMDDFEQAIERVIAGLKKHARLIAPEERRVIAHHEAGHALVGWFLEHTDPVVKVSVVPRGTSTLGHARALPEERDLYSKEALLDRMAVALGGRAAEKVALGRVTTGAQDDLKHVTERAYAMVAHYGMSDRIGPLSYAPSGREAAAEPPAQPRPYSDAVAEAIDQEAQALVEEAQARATTLLQEKRALLDQTAEALLEHEVLGGEALTELLGAPPPAEHGEREGRSGQAETPAGHHAEQDGSSSESASSGGTAETTKKTAP